MFGEIDEVRRRATEAQLDADRALAALRAHLLGGDARPGDLTACILALGEASEREMAGSRRA